MIAGLVGYVAALTWLHEAEQVGRGAFGWAPDAVGDYAGAGARLVAGVGGAFVAEWIPGKMATGFQAGCLLAAVAAGIGKGVELEMGQPPPDAPRDPEPIPGDQSLRVLEGMLKLALLLDPTAGWAAQVAARQREQRAIEANR